MAELLDLSKHKAKVESEAIKADMANDRLAHWKQNAIPGCHIPMGFPALLAFADNSVEDQITHVFSEAKELADDLADPEKSKNGMWLLELLDLHHSIETLERLLVDRYGPEVLNNARLMVLEKNAERGYYGLVADPSDG